MDQVSSPTSTSPSIAADFRGLPYPSDEQLPKNATASVSVVEEEVPMKSTFMFNDKKRVRETEEVEDFFILHVDYSCSSSSALLNDSTEDGLAEDGLAEDDLDVGIVAEQGQVACRDYPHPRELCVKYHFKKTPHEVHCEMCYCYICDVPAPCEEWLISHEYFRHCDAVAHIPLCEILRSRKRHGHLR